MEANGDVFREICRKSNWKCTTQRRAVYSYICGNTEHPSAETVWKNVRALLPDVSLDSIYRILNEFAAKGIINRLESGEVFRFDPNTVRHDHFLCNKCGRVFDFEFLDGERLRLACSDIGAVDSVELHVKGVCADCRANGFDRNHRV